MTSTRTERGLSITIALTAATLGVVYGYDTGSIAGALLFIPPISTWPRPSPRGATPATPR